VVLNFGLVVVGKPYNMDFHEEKSNPDLMRTALTARSSLCQEQLTNTKVNNIHTP